MPPPQINHPLLWQHLLPIPTAEGNKYSRGSAVVMGGDIASTGASRLAAIAALRAGAGLVTVACPIAALPVYASSLTAVMVSPYQHDNDLDALLNDPRKNAFLIGPGHGVNEHTKQVLMKLLHAQKTTVIDADAITLFQENPFALFDALAQFEGKAVLTPHEGEFKRLFSLGEDRIAAAAEAAKLSHSVVILKGSETVIADPTGHIVINPPASPWLATAGSGDVLAGILTGLLAASVDLFPAACMATWMHGEAAKMLGAGLIAEDLPQALPRVWQTLLHITCQN